MHSMRFPAFRGQRVIGVCALLAATATIGMAADFPKIDLRPVYPKITLQRPLWMSEVPYGSGRMFVIEQAGRILVMPGDHNASEYKVALDITGRQPQEDTEEGLLGMAFHPKFKENQKVYVHYNQHNPRRSVVSEVLMSKTDRDVIDISTERILLEVPQPYGNHKGGCTIFGPDGYLYISFGDGGTVLGDPHNNGQRLNVLLGKILRIDVDTRSDDKAYGIPKDNPFVGKERSLPEIYTYGMRNPWRMSFDTKTGLLWAGDVGQDKWEEVDIIKKGGNYGWRIREGLHPYKTNGVPANITLIDPIIEYPHNTDLGKEHTPGASVTGGYVYRGAKIPALSGVYIYGDFVAGTIWGARYESGHLLQDGVLLEMPKMLNPPRNISSFAQDLAGEVYVVAFDGKIYEIVEAK
jgi:glucose/arabinose dehydrogenase